MGAPIEDVYVLYIVAIKAASASVRCDFPTPAPSPPPPPPSHLFPRLHSSTVLPIPICTYRAKRSKVQHPQQERHTSTYLSISKISNPL